MTLLAGIYLLEAGMKIAPKVVDLLEGSIARTEGKINRYVDERFALTKWDCEAFKAQGILEDEAGITAITGEPYWEDTQTGKYSRTYDLEKMSEELRKENIRFLISCHGNYSVCHYDKSERRLILAADKLGVRPIYYVVHGNVLYFASALRILESVECIPKKFNLAAFVEKRVFGVPLGTNTKYCDVKVLRDGQYIVCDGSGFKVAYYFRWVEIEPSNSDLESIKERCYKAFCNAVAIRSSRDSNFFALLSGGLDSRCVVSVLNDIGKNAITFNFSLAGEKDEHYAKKYADWLGIQYYPEHRPVTNWNLWDLISQKLSTIDRDSLKQVKYPRLIFGGDGGSVGMGHVYLTGSLLKEYRDGGREAAMDSFLSRRTLPDRIFRRKVREIIRSVPREGLVKELKELDGVVPGRDFYLFLLRNDQRRHLHGLWESIDLARVEFLEPFYDTRLLSVVASAPIETFIGHRFYYDWLDLFPADIKSVPWQAYPGHEPCPIATDDESVSQWDNYPKVERMVKDESYRKIWNALSSKKFPYHLSNRFLIYAAIAAYKISKRDVTYIFELASDLYADHSKCSNTQMEQC
jgi:hypothetical protein